MRKRMKRVSRSYLVIFALAAMLAILSGCTTSKAYVYKVETGDTIEVKLNTTGGYDLTSSLPFRVTQKGQTFSQGIFITLDTYEQYLRDVNLSGSAELIENKTENGLEYIFYSYEDSEYNYVIRIVGSDTGVLLGNNVSEESARECFERLTFTQK